MITTNTNKGNNIKSAYSFATKHMLVGKESTERSTFLFKIQITENF